MATARLKRQLSKSVILQFVSAAEAARRPKTDITQRGHAHLTTQALPPSVEKAVVPTVPPATGQCPLGKMLG
jgi:hypothetical protein